MKTGIGVAPDNHPGILRLCRGTRTIDSPSHGGKALRHIPGNAWSDPASLPRAQGEESRTEAGAAESVSAAGIRWRACARQYEETRNSHG